MTINGLIKMKCCVVLASLAISDILSLTHSSINAGISGTIALIYGIALIMFLSIACYDRCINKNHPIEMESSSD